MSRDRAPSAAPTLLVEGAVTALALLVGGAPPALAQTADDFDADRAMLSDAPMFDAFYPTEYEPLAAAVRDRRVGDDTALLVLRRGERTLTFLTMQMAYHHVAQGELAGEPWMVSF